MDGPDSLLSTINFSTDSAFFCATAGCDLILSFIYFSFDSEFTSLPRLCLTLGGLDIKLISIVEPPLLLFNFSIFGFIIASRQPTVLKMQNIISISLVLKTHLLPNHEGNKENNEKWKKEIKKRHYVAAVYVFP